MKRLLPVLVLALLACTGDTVAQSSPTADRGALPDCEWCGAHEAPDDLDWTVTIAPPDEPGERMVLEGTVTESDGVTPASGVILYAYHTDDDGLYSKRGDETRNGQRHGRLRGWLRTDADGRYRIDTVRPGTYPSRSEPAHVHFTVLPPGGEEDWLPSVVFEGDPLITDEDPDRIVTLERDDEGVWRGTWDPSLRE